ncbi:unnamed protein product [Adineta ricciae]|uniref:Uncharacterized protein n=1 Tax=Adineta ricciae TaxID=249248 RepID=A0A814JAJ9_ADIRI|nr:unnamed protein product [Adineta ricciae]
MQEIPLDRHESLSLEVHRYEYLIQKQVQLEYHFDDFSIKNAPARSAYIPYDRPDMLAKLTITMTRSFGSNGNVTAPLLIHLAELIKIFDSGSWIPSLLASFILQLITLALHLSGPDSKMLPSKPDPPDGTPLSQRRQPY